MHIINYVYAQVHTVQIEGDEGVPRFSLEPDPRIQTHICVSNISNVFNTLNPLLSFIQISAINVHEKICYVDEHIHMITPMGQPTG